ncbi:hypothetical protein HGRIS_001657 [Hohenbuehelia grisea]|uniref:Uncharacterized protein n=1 Tax=Hohenbuehelia grisea TaxID=104357 RepID=A0ABR3JIW6_9AGAR
MHPPHIRTIRHKTIHHRQFEDTADDDDDDKDKDKDNDRDDDVDSKGDKRPSRVKVRVSVHGGTPVHTEITEPEPVSLVVDATTTPPSSLPSSDSFSEIVQISATPIPSPFVPVNPSPQPTAEPSFSALSNKTRPGSRVSPTSVSSTASTTSSTSPTPPPIASPIALPVSASSSQKTPIIIGSTISAVAFILLIALAAAYLFRRRVWASQMAWMKARVVELETSGRRESGMESPSPPPSYVSDEPVIMRRLGV